MPFETQPTFWSAPTWRRFGPRDLARKGLKAFCLSLLLLHPLSSPAQTNESPACIIVGKEVFGTTLGLELTKQARALDPNLVPGMHFEESIRLYREAIQAQHGAPINVILAERIAEMQAFGGRKKDKTPLTNDFGAAAWELMISCTNSNQFKWGAAHYGAAVAYMRVRKPEEMERCLNKIMGLRAENLADPDWLAANIDPATCQLRHKASQNPQMKAGLDSMQQSALGLLTKLHAGRKRQQSRERMEKIAETQMDQPVGQLAHEVAMQIHWHANTNSAPPIVADETGGGKKTGARNWLLWLSPFFAAAISLLLIKRKPKGSLK